VTAVIFAKLTSHFGHVVGKPPIFYHSLPAETGFEGSALLAWREPPGRIMDEVPTVIRGTLKHPKHEPLLEGDAERIHAAVRQLKELGIVDEKRNRLRTDLPEDMEEGADRHFGG
jgi:hypothetical protein